MAYKRAGKQTCNAQEQGAKKKKKEKKKRFENFGETLKKKRREVARVPHPKNKMNNTKRELNVLRTIAGGRGTTQRAAYAYSTKTPPAYLFMHMKQPNTHS